MPIIGLHFSNSEGEPFDAIVDEKDCASLGVAFLDFECPDASGIINSGVLITLDALLVFVFECQKLNVNLDLVASLLLLITNSISFAKPGAAQYTA